MFVHTVYFWLKPGITAEEKRDFLQRGSALTTLPSVKHGWLGVPADTDRAIIDRSYSYGLAVIFDDEAGHDAYQVHPLHDAFRELHGLWTQVKIYDFEG